MKAQHRSKSQADLSRLPSTPLVDTSIPVLSCYTVQVDAMFVEAMHTQDHLGAHMPTLRRQNAEDPAKKGICSNFLCDAKPGDEVTMTGAPCYLFKCLSLLPCVKHSTAAWQMYPAPCWMMMTV